MRRNFRYGKPGGQPKFKVGKVAGEFEIIAYIGQSTVHPVKAVILSTDHHWYKCRCSCGNIETHTQQTLVDNRRKRQCAECSNKG